MAQINPFALDAITNNPLGRRVAQKFKEITDILSSGATGSTKTPVNAVAASKVLTVGALPTDKDTVSIGGVVYRFRNYIGAGTAASKDLTFSGVGVAAQTVTIGSTVYTFRASVSAAYDVQIGATATNSADNLVAAITAGAGAGTAYGTGTVIHPTVTATRTSTATVSCVAKSIGIAGNLIALAETQTNALWTGGATFMTGGNDAQVANDVLMVTNAETSIDNLVLAINAGAGAGTNYATGTVVNPLASAVKASPSTMTCTNKIKGVIGNSTVIAESGSNLSWAGAAVLLSGGVDGTLGKANEICNDGSFLYVCTADNTTAGSNWLKTALSAV